MSNKYNSTKQNQLLKWSIAIHNTSQPLFKKVVSINVNFFPSSIAKKQKTTNDDGYNSDSQQISKDHKAIDSKKETMNSPPLLPSTDQFLKSLYALNEFNDSKKISSLYELLSNNILDEHYESQILELAKDTDQFRESLCILNDYKLIN